MRLAVLLLALALAPITASAQTVIINSNIAVNTTWGPTGTVVGDVFWVQANVQVNAGVTLTIQPGVIVKYNVGNIFYVRGTLNADGAPGDEIIFTSIRDDVGGDTNGDGGSTTPAAGNWYGIYYYDSASDASLLDYCDLRYAGFASYAAVTFVDNSSTISNSVIRISTYGVDCQGNSAPNITNTSIEASTQTPVVLDFTAAPVLSSLVFSSSNNGYDAFGLRGGTLSGAATLPQRGATVGVNPITNVTYVLISSLTIASGGSLTVAPGVVIKPVSGQNIWVQSGGNLTMNGTAAAGDTITVTSIHDDNFGTPNDTNNNGSITAPAPGNWNRLLFDQGSTGSIQHCRLKFGSNSTTQGMVEMTNNNIGVSNTLLSDAAHGLATFGTSNPVVSNVTIQNCTSTPVYESISARVSYSNVLFIANAVTAVGLRGETIAVDSRLPVRNLGGFNNITYYVMNGTITMNSPSVLRIDPGVVVKNEIFTGGFIINGALVADAKPESLIVFTSVRDDLYGNPPDTNGDGSITVPAVNNWGYIQFNATSDDVVSKIDYCRITYGSYDGGATSWPALLRYQGAAAPVTNSFLGFGSYGIIAAGVSTPLIDMNTITNCSNAPIVMSVQSDPNITVNNTYATNGFNALALISETIAQNSTIKYRPGVGSPTFAYLPTGTITVASGVTLSVEPQVVFKPTSSFVVFSVNGSLNVIGSNPTTGRIIFTSRRDDNPLFGGDTTPNDASTPQAGDWGSLQFNDTSVDGACIVRNCLFQFGGAGGQDQGVLTTVGAAPRFARNEFFQNITAMTFKGASQPTVDSTAILNCTQLPIVWSLVSDPVFPNPSRITLANNTYTAFGILGETVAQDVTTRVRALGSIANMPYAPTTTVTIAFGAKWTIRPGVVMKLGRYATDPTGIQININGALIADGKPDSLIVFTSMADDAFGGDTMGDGAATTPVPGHWGGIAFTGISDDAATVVDHCRFRYGGVFNTGHLNFANAGPTISNTFSTRASQYGVLIEGASSPTFNDCFVDSSTNVPVQMSLVSNPVFNNVQFLGNTYTALGIIGESIAQDVLWPVRAVSGRDNMPYLLQGQLTTGLGATVTMQPGVMVKSTGGGSIRIQRAFVSEGRSQPESLIVFTSYRDDFYGGDTNMDGGTTVPTASDWNYVWVDGTAIDPDVRFLNTVFRYGGSGTTLGALRCVNSSPSVDSCIVAFNAVGISVEGASNPTVNGCSIYGNTQFGINNTGGSFCVNAENNWWGHTSGPNDNSATVDLCLLGVNAGTGDRVSNNVDYNPWSTAGVQSALLGDVSLNGQVLAFDASLVLQYVALLIPLSPLQQLVADVSGAAGITAFDASLILQYVAGLIPAFPAASSKPGELSPEAAAAQQVVDAAQGAFQVTLGDAVRDGDGWLVPVRVTGSAPAYSAELRLEGAAAARLEAVEVSGEGALAVHGVQDGVARIGVAGLAPLTGEIVLRFGADGAAELAPPAIVWARVNENQAELAPPPPPIGPAISFVAPPAPNPARSSVSLALGVSAEDAAAPVRIVLYDIAGRSVRVLHDGVLPAGLHDLRWDLRRGDGSQLATGIYFVKARTKTVQFTHRVVVVR